MKISIIIPTYNEADTISKLIPYLRKNSQVNNIQSIIIADGGSTDSTIECAKSLGVQVICTEKGRAIQMNAGASVSQGEILYFLHADSCPPTNFDTQIIETVNQGMCSGSYRLRFDDDHPVLRFCCALVNRLKNRSLGDRSLFVERHIFEQIGGYDETLTVMEDADIVKRLNKVTTFGILPADIITSSRKFKENGELRLFLIFVLIYVLYELGVSETRLLRLYKTLIRQNKI